jgi:hypothetical protein
MSNLQRVHKNKIDYDCADFYVNFTSMNAELNITQKLHTQIIKTFMKIALRKIVLEMYRLPFPGLGLFYMVKNKYNINKKEDGSIDVVAEINWPATKEVRERTGDNTKKVFYLNDHTNGYIYRLKWDKHNIGFVNKKFYSFVPATKVKQYMFKEISSSIKPLNAYI